MDIFKMIDIGVKVGDVLMNGTKKVSEKTAKTVSKVSGFSAFKDENKKSLLSFLANNTMFTTMFLGCITSLLIATLHFNPKLAEKIVLALISLLGS